jgi:hypothetical protein
VKVQLLFLKLGFVIWYNDYSFLCLLNDSIVTAVRSPTNQQTLTVLETYITILISIWDMAQCKPISISVTLIEYL